MSRIILSCSLIVALASLADARAVSQFARPPAEMPHVAPPNSDVPTPPDNGSFTRPEPRLDRDTVRAALLRARETNLAAFRAYVKRGVFPSNTFKNGKLHVWRDAAGNFCAAATIIKASGQDDLVVKVAEQNNFIALIDVRQGPLMDWMLTSGFTQEEIDAIQEPGFMVRRPIEPVPPILVDADKRKAEDIRLLATYKIVDRMLVKSQKRNVELAVDRLLKHQTLAWQLVDD